MNNGFKQAFLIAAPFTFALPGRIFVFYQLFDLLISPFRITSDAGLVKLEKKAPFKK